MFNFFKKSTKTKNTLKKIALVDYENFHNLDVVLKAKFDLVKLFVGSHQDKVSLPAFEMSTNIEIIKVTKCDKNSLDCILSAECGKYFAEYEYSPKSIKLYIFSSDKGFDALTDHYNSFSVIRVAKEHTCPTFIKEARRQIANIGHVHKFMLSDEFRNTKMREKKGQRAKDLLAKYLGKYYAKDLDTEALAEYIVNIKKAIGFSSVENGGYPVIHEKLLETAVYEYKRDLIEKVDF
ncbi:PIN domain-containing protein [Francisella philomiragia]